MSEKLHHRVEFEAGHGGETAHHHAEKLREQAEHEQNHGSKEHVSEVLKKVEQHAVSIEKPSAEGHEQHAQAQHKATKDLKELSFSRTLVRVRKRLNSPEKVLSRVVHQPVIDRVSEFGAKTIARPASLFGGGLFALVGTSVLFYLTKKYGYEFNYLVFLMTFVAGFVAGSILEIAFRLLRLRRQ